MKVDRRPAFSFPSFVERWLTGNKETELQSLRKLLPYVQHKEECPSRYTIVVEGKLTVGECTCGLDEIRKEL
jgi:hypothetical protein